MFLRVVAVIDNRNFHPSAGCLVRFGRSFEFLPLQFLELYLRGIKPLLDVCRKAWFRF